ncbi:MAG: ribosome maturation factor RimP [Peptococcaceae bacterium]|nr:ribosome maturation factor RimP [Peptococcaceae bacterium]
MGQSTIAKKVETLVEPVVEKHGFELVDVEYVKEGGRWFLRIFIDKPGGISLDDCEIISKEIGPLLDEKDFIPHSYYLEVSSAGLERPLKKRSDFEKFQGRLVKVSTFAPVEGRKKFTGYIQQSDHNGFIINTEDEEFRIAWDNLAKARLVVEF